MSEDASTPTTSAASGSPVPAPAYASTNNPSHQKDPHLHDNEPSSASPLRGDVQEFQLQQSHQPSQPQGSPPQQLRQSEERQEQNPVEPSSHHQQQLHQQQEDHHHQHQQQQPVLGSPTALATELQHHHQQQQQSQLPHQQQSQAQQQYHQGTTQLQSAHRPPQLQHQQPQNTQRASVPSLYGQALSPNLGNISTETGGASFLHRASHPGPDQSPLQHNPHHGADSLPPANSLHFGNNNPERSTMPRPYPPILSPGAASMPYGSPINDPRQQGPISPRTIPTSMTDFATPQESPGAIETAPRKRSKVSRACDECRRKKIRCDIPTDSGEQQCTNCKRSSAKCSFSRVPLKRGPSKGYIKELAERVQSLETSIATGEQHNYAPFGEREPSPGSLGRSSPTPLGGGVGKRKRISSTSSDFHGPVTLQPLTQHSPAARPSERLPPIDSFHSGRLQQSQQPPYPSIAQQTQYSAQQTPPVSASSDVSYRAQQSPNGAFWKGKAPDLGYSNAFSGSQAQQVASFEWDEDVVDQYYAFIHPTFPLLQNSKDRLRQRLGEVTADVRNALLDALYCAVRVHPASTVRSKPSVTAKTVSESVSAIQGDDKSVKTFPTNLLLLQIFILLTIEADTRGPARMLGLAGTPKSQWLGQAVGLAYNLRLHTVPMKDTFDTEDSDRDEKLCRRAWFVLVILDKWNLMSTSSPPMIKETYISLEHGDRELLGDGAYWLVKISLALGHIAEAAVAPSDLVPASAYPFICKAVRSELDTLMEHVREKWDGGDRLDAAFYHVRLLMYQMMDGRNVSCHNEILETALKILQILDSRTRPTTPLDHHFYALAIFELLKLLEIHEIRDAAWNAVTQLLDSMSSKRAGREDGRAWEKALVDLVARRREALATRGLDTARGSIRGSLSLQHLAELAVGERSPNADTPSPTSSSAPTLPQDAELHSMDLIKLRNHGYLGSLVATA